MNIDLNWVLWGGLFPKWINDNDNPQVGYLRFSVLLTGHLSESVWLMLIKNRIVKKLFSKREEEHYNTEVFKCICSIDTYLFKFIKKEVHINFSLKSRLRKWFNFLHLIAYKYIKWKKLRNYLFIALFISLTLTQCFLTFNLIL